MNKKIISFFAVALVSIFLLTNSAFAGYEEIYTVGSYGSTTPQSSFAWDTTPWLYLELPDSSLNATGSWWESPTNDYYMTGTSGSEDSQQWISLDSGQDKDGNDITWAGVKETGSWNIRSGYIYANNPSDPWGGGSTSFTVTPEPVSSILFLVGGASLVGFRRRKNKLIAV